MCSATWSPKAAELVGKGKATSSELGPSQNRDMDTWAAGLAAAGAMITAAVRPFLSISAASVAIGQGEMAPN